MITSLIEEAEAISWYEQRMSVEKGREGDHGKPRRRKSSDWRTEIESILFTKGDIVKQGEAAEKNVEFSCAAISWSLHERGPDAASQRQEAIKTGSA